MNRYKNILVLLNLDKGDLLSLKYASLISNLAGPSKFYFTHFTESFNVPKNILSEYPVLSEKVEDIAIEKIRKLVEENFKGCSSSSLEYANITCTHESGFTIHEGLPVDELIKMNIEKDIDLVIFSYDQQNEDSVAFAKRIVRKSFCSVLAVTGKADGEHKDILVPIDFSDHTKEAVEVACAFAEANKINKINSVNVYNVPTGFYKTGKTYEEFAELMKKNAKNAFADYIRSIDTHNISIDDLYFLNNNPVKGIIQAVSEKGIDLIVISSRGRSAATSIFLGNIPDKLISGTVIPILFVRKKGEGLNAFKVLMGMMEI
jgi:nucleotide-binding universal stress UspA family protein